MTEASNPKSDPLDTPAQFVPGVGPDRAVLLAKMNLLTARDLLFNMPRDVLDLTDVCPVQNLEAGKDQTVLGEVVDLSLIHI